MGQVQVDSQNDFYNQYIDKTQYLILGTLLDAARFVVVIRTVL